MGAKIPVPALFTRISIAPNVPMVLATASRTASVSAASALIASAKPIVSRPMQRGAHDRVECARDSCEADVRLAGADAQPGGEHHSSVGPFEPSVAAHR